MIAVDYDGSIIGWNSLAETTFGWTEAEALGRSIHETIIPERDREAHVRGLARYKSGAATDIFGTRFERAAVRVDGDEIPIELSIMCINSLGDDLLVCFIRDLSEQERARKAYEELQLRLLHVARISAMGTMATTLAHELNQPLTAANNYLNTVSRLMESGDAPSSLADAKVGLKLGQDAVKRAAETIKSVRAMMEKKPMRLQPHRLRLLVHDAIRLLGSNLSVRPEVKIPAEAEWVNTSKVQLEQVLINLLRNASDALSGHPSPRIAVTACKNGDYVEIRVSDNGPGVPSERLEDLFSPFNSTKETGLGMGLSICRTLVEQNAGKIWADAGHDGATLAFSIPLASP